MPSVEAIAFRLLLQAAVGDSGDHDHDNEEVVDSGLDDHADHDHDDEHTDHDHDYELDHDDHDVHGSDGDRTKDLRIAAIFIILAAGLLGGIPPLLIKTFRDQGSPVRLLLRAMSAGIIIALACIHIIPVANESMHGLTENLNKPYPHLGGAVVAFGVVLMIVAEAITHSLLESNLAAKAGICAHDHHGHSHDTELGEMTGKEMVVVVKELDVSKEASRAGAIGVGVDDQENHHHHHLPLAAANTGSLRQQVLAYMFELGCIFHSVIIGITLGVETESKSSVVAMLITLAFHQLLEGIALSSFVIDAAIGLRKAVSMITLYAVTCPIGVAIGIGISTSYDANSNKAKAVEGTFNGLSGGMLLYIGLVQLVAEDFDRKTLMARAPNAWMRVACYAALAFGVGAMAILGIWEGGHGGEVEDAHIH